MAKITRKRMKPEPLPELPKFETIEIPEPETGWREDLKRKAPDNRFCKKCIKNKTCILTTIAMVACCIKYEEKKKKSITK